MDLEDVDDVGPVDQPVHVHQPPPLSSYPPAHQGIWQAVMAIWSEEVTTAQGYVPTIVPTVDGTAIRGVLFGDTFRNIKDALVFASGIVHPVEDRKPKRKADEVANGDAHSRRRKGRRSSKQSLVFIHSFFAFCA